MRAKSVDKTGRIESAAEALYLLDGYPLTGTSREQDDVKYTHKNRPSRADTPGGVS